MMEEFTERYFNESSYDYIIEHSGQQEKLVYDNRLNKRQVQNCSANTIHTMAYLWHPLGSAE